LKSAIDIEKNSESDGTEKIEDSDSDAGRTPPSRSPATKKKDEGEGLTIGQIAKKYNKSAGNKFFNKDSDDDDDKPKKSPSKVVKKSKTFVPESDEDDGPKNSKKAKESASKNFKKSQTSTFDFDLDEKPKKKKTPVDPDSVINGPLTGYTIVCTGVMDILGRDQLKDLLKSLGA
jgi:NAD-dependent DNA ligase